MAQVAEFLEKRGDRNAANFLIHVARQLAEALRLSSSTPSSSPLPNSDSQLDFLLQVLQATLNNIGNLEAVYPLVQMNLDKLDDNFAHLLRDWATANLSQVKPEEARRIAEDIGNFSFLIQQFRLGNKASNLEIAITGYEIAATVFTREAFPEKWAKIQNNLGEAYRNRIRGDKLQNLEKAVVVLQDALPYIPEECPALRAVIQNNLGLAYRDQGQIEQAIALHKEALKLYSSKGLSEQWADTQNYLGNAYSDQGQIDQAMEAYENALKVYTPRTDKWADAQNNRALVFKSQGQIDQAIAIYQDLLEIYTGEECLEQWARTQYHLGHAYRDVGQIDDAIKSYHSSLKVYTSTTFPIDCLHSGGSLGNTAFAAERWSEAIKGYGVAIEALEQSRAWANTDDRRTKILEDQLSIYINMVQACIKTDQPEKAIEYVERSKVRNLVERFAKRNLYPKGNIPTDVLKTLDYLRQKILHLEKILTHVPNTCNRVILIPHRFLHLFPLHALPLPNQKDICLLDKFPGGVRYAPSCQLLQLTEKQERPDFSHFFGIQNPTQDLTYANLEVQAVRRFFEPAYVLVEKNAKKNAFSTSPHTEHLRAAHCVHFSCHGEFNYESPLESKLLLADHKPLTIGEIFGLDFSQCRLVTLSACETGLTNFLSLSDEYISLPSGFLYAGSPSVVSSLWAVSDLSTAFLMIKFYENFRQSQRESGAVAIALNQAQQWLRNLTSEEFEIVLDQLKPRIEQVFAQLPKSKYAIFKASLEQTRKRKPYPFANPSYWAAFTATGF